MLVQNGAKDEVVEAVKQLQCQICKRVCPPEIAPKAAFTRPSRFNERLVADFFHIWDTNQMRYTVTHVMCAFSMYIQAILVKDANAQTTAELIRDRWIQVFGPPSVLMSDQGSEFMGQLEPMLKAFAVMHEVVPPTAHWRMALAERHGAVLKLMMMKMVNEVSANNINDMRMVLSSAITARNQLFSFAVGFREGCQHTTQFDDGIGGSAQIPYGHADGYRGRVPPCIQRTSCSS